MTLLEALETSAIAAFLKTSFTAYPILNAAHILAIGQLLATIFVMDAAAIGIIRWNREKHARRRRLALIIFAAVLITGFLLFSVKPTEYVYNTAFQIKILLICLAGVNAMIFEWRLAESDETGFSPMIRVIAVISILLWLLVLIAGRFIGFV